MVFPQRYGAVAASAGDESVPLVRPRAHDRSSFRTVAIGVSTLALGVVGMLGVAMNRGVDYSVSSSTSLVQRALGYAVSPAPKREITFKVHVCGVPTQVWNPYVPFDVCRVKLVGCPGGGSSCKHWRYADGLEMQPTDGQMNTFTITTSEYAAGDVFGFAVVKNGCKVSDEISCEQDSLGSCKEKDICDHRYDSGTNGAKNDITCWEGSSVCSSNSPFIPEASNTACFTQMGEFFNRVVPDSGSNVEYVWGTCQTNVAESEKGACAARTTCGSRDGGRDDDDDRDGGRDDDDDRDGGRDDEDRDGGRDDEDRDGGRDDEDRDGEHENDDHESRSDGLCDATDNDFGAITGACTQSCGTGNGDCDKTCQAAVDADSSLVLDCIIDGTGNTKCSCSNVGGGTKDECTDYKSGYKCCTCKTMKKRSVDSCLDGQWCAAKLVSENGDCEAQTQEDGNFVIYGPNESVVWATNTASKGKGPYKTVMQTQGNLVLYDSKSVAIWATGSEYRGTGPYKTIMQNDCNLVIYDSKSKAIWDSKGGLAPI